MCVESRAVSEFVGMASMQKFGGVRVLPLLPANMRRQQEEEEEKEKEEEGDSGTESVPEVKETVLWEEKVTFANLPCNNQPMVDGL